MGASAAINMKWVGVGPSGGGEIIADQTSGPKAKTLYGYGTLVSGSTATTAPVNFIDGVQSLGKTAVLPLWKVAVDATTATYADYYSTAALNQIKVGDTVAVTGFTNSGNNVTNLVVSQVNSQYFSASNSGVVAETNPAATVTDSTGGTPVWIDVFYAGNPGLADSTTAAGIFATGVNKFVATALTNTGFTLNYPTVTTSGVTIQFGAVLAFSS